MMAHSSKDMNAEWPVILPTNKNNMARYSIKVRYLSSIYAEKVWL
jgi:hypothetical protein